MAGAEMNYNDDEDEEDALPDPAASRMVEVPQPPSGTNGYGGKVDPRIAKYLSGKVGAAMQQSTPDFQRQQAELAGQDASAKRSNDLANLLMNSASKFGSVGGKTADTSGYNQMTKGLNADVDDQANMRQGMMQRDAAIDPRIVQYLKNQDTAQSRADNLDLGNRKLAQSAQMADENRQARADSQRKHDEVMGAFKGNKDELDTEKGLRNFATDVGGSIRNNIGDEGRKLRNSAHAMSILGNRKDLDQLTNLEVSELGAAFAAQLQQGSPGEQIIQNVTPKTASGDLAKLYSYVTGAAAPTNQGELVGKLKELFGRQQDASKKIMTSAIAPHVIAARGLKKKAPQEYDDILASQGIKLDDTGNVIGYEPPYLDKISSGPTTAPPPPPTGQVKIKSPDGEIRLVSPDAVKKYTDKGGVVVP